MPSEEELRRIWQDRQELKDLAHLLRCEVADLPRRLEDLVEDCRVLADRVAVLGRRLGDAGCTADPHDDGSGPPVRGA